MQAIGTASGLRPGLLGATLILRFLLPALAFSLIGVVLPGKVNAGSPTCTASTTSIAFGSVDVIAGAAVDTTATVTVTCSGGSGNGQRLCISIGSGATFTGSTRQLLGPNSARLNYELYEDAARTIPWGSWQTGWNSSGFQTDVAQSSTTATVVYARLFGSQQTALAGSYSSAFTANPYIQYDDKGALSCPTGNKAVSNSTTATATVVTSCTVSVTNLSFGTAGLLTSNIDATSSVAPQCTNGLPYTVSLDGGLTGANDPTQRKMTRTSEQVTYGLYLNAARSLPWGSTVGTNTASQTGTGLTQSIVVYGRIPPQTGRSPGTYTDSVVVTVIY